MRLNTCLLAVSLAVAACSPDRDKPVGDHGQTSGETWHYENGSAWFGVPASESLMDITCKPSGSIGITYAADSDDKGKVIIVGGKTKQVRLVSNFSGSDDTQYYYLDAEIPRGAPVLADILKHKSYRFGVGDALGDVDSHPAVLRVVSDCVRK